MNFVKGVVVGGLLVTGMTLMYAEMGNSEKKKVMKKGRQIIKKMGMAVKDDIKKIKYIIKRHN